MADKEDTLRDKRARKLSVFALLAQGKSASEVSRATGVNKGTVSRWRSGKEFALWLADREVAGGKVVEFPRHNSRGATTAEPDPVVRGRFLNALKTSGRIDVAATYSQADPQAVARWLVEGDPEITSAQAEAYLRGVQVIANLMQGKDGAGNPLKMRPSDILRAAKDYVMLTDFGRQQAQASVSIDISAEKRQVLATRTATPVSIITDELRRQFAGARHADLLADTKDAQ